MHFEYTALVAHTNVSSAFESSLSDGDEFELYLGTNTLEVRRLCHIIGEAVDLALNFWKALEDQDWVAKK